MPTFAEGDVINNPMICLDLLDPILQASCHTKRVCDAEVLQMEETLLGKSNFWRGMDLYFKCHHGKLLFVKCSWLLCLMPIKQSS
jgi:hypothetical protein